MLVGEPVCLNTASVLLLPLLTEHQNCVFPQGEQVYYGASASYFRTEAEPLFEKHLIFEINMLMAKIMTPH